CMQSAEYPLTF
nr:immunoglobulin light chain junction region [Macaca mulatta]MOV37228.1 immunoglobulin light chain junction region [Macaca mulatta]MOV37342.1 immunoglobulin light chain junction region [Macaca mulatta]MOV37397.1 immunoglobulin light chain junction region [Macaca mulatta]